MNCLLCRLPMRINNGLQWYHGQCRTEGRKKYGAMKDVITSYKSQWRATGQMAPKANEITLQPTWWQKLIMWIRRYVRF